MRRFAVILLLCSSFLASGQQDPLYSQYLFNQAIINPAYAGAHDLFSATLISRNQWLGLDGAPQTNTLNVHSSFFKNRIGLGLTFMNDQLGVNSNNEVSMAYAYKVKFRKSILALGLQAGITTFKYDYTQLDFEFMNDPSFMPAQESFSKTNFGTGVFYMGENYYLGASAPRLGNVEVNDGVITSTRYKRHIYFSGGYVFDQVFAVKFKPSFLVRMIEGENPSVDLNANVLLNEILWLGLMVRNFNTYGFNAQVSIAQRFRFGYSFELPSSNLITSSFGSHEFMIGLDLAIFARQGGNFRYF